MIGKRKRGRKPIKYRAIVGVVMDMPGQFRLREVIAQAEALGVNARLATFERVMRDLSHEDDGRLVRVGRAGMLGGPIVYEVVQ